MAENVTEKQLTEAEAIWTLEPGEIRKPGVHHLVATALMTGIGIVVGTFGSLSIPLGYISGFWPGQAIQGVGAIWFGWWGVIAATVFPMISNSLSGAAPLVVSLTYIPAQLAESVPAGWIFRKMKLDPRLRSSRDWIWFTIMGVLVPNALGAAWGSTMLRMYGLITPEAHLFTLLGWFGGNVIPGFLVGALMLKFISPLVIKSKAFCKGWWA